MAIKDRVTLKGYFVKNAIPTQEQFADLIDSTVLRSQSSKMEAPLELKSSAGSREMIQFYGGDDDQVLWSLSLESTSQKPGFAVQSGGEDHLFIDQTTGHVGIGTDEPQQALDVKGGLRLFADTGSILLTHDGAEPSDNQQAAISNDSTDGTLKIFGVRAADGDSRKVSVEGELEVDGAIELKQGGITYPDGTVQTSRYIDTLHSGSRRFRLVMQSDGNLVIYDGGAAIWQSNTRR